MIRYQAKYPVALAQSLLVPTAEEQEPASVGLPAVRHRVELEGESRPATGR